MTTHHKNHREIILTTELTPVKLCRSHDCGSYVPYHYHDAYEFIYLINGSININSLHQHSPLSLFIAQLPPLPSEIPTQLNFSLKTQEQAAKLNQAHSPDIAPVPNTIAPTEALSTTASLQISKSCYAAQMDQKLTSVNSSASDKVNTTPLKRSVPNIDSNSSYDKNPHALQLLEDIASGQADPLRYITKTKAQSLDNQNIKKTPQAPTISTHLISESVSATTSTQTTESMKTSFAKSPITFPEVPYSESDGTLDFATGLTINPKWQIYANDNSYTTDKAITYKLSPNGYNFALINSNEMHASSCPLWNDAFVLQIPEGFIKKLLKYPEDFPLYFNPHLASNECLQRFGQAFWRIVIVLENYQQKPSFQIHFNHALYAILECLLEMMVTNTTLSQLQALNYPIASNTNLKRLQPVFDFLNHHYQEQLKLEQIAAVVHLHPSYFCQIFKNTVGMSPLNYLSELRLYHIYYDLSEQKQPISELLQRHGYTNSKKFYRHFKERFHQSPSKVRQQHASASENEFPSFKRI